MSDSTLRPPRPDSPPPWFSPVPGYNLGNGNPSAPPAAGLAPSGPSWVRRTAQRAGRSVENFLDRRFTPGQQGSSQEADPADDQTTQESETAAPPGTQRERKGAIFVRSLTGMPGMTTRQVGQYNDQLAAQEGVGFFQRLRNPPHDPSQLYGFSGASPRTQAMARVSPRLPLAYEGVKWSFRGNRYAPDPRSLYRDQLIYGGTPSFGPLQTSRIQTQKRGIAPGGTYQAHRRETVNMEEQYPTGSGGTSGGYGQQPMQQMPVYHSVAEATRAAADVPSDPLHQTVTQQGLDTNPATMSRLERQRRGL